MDDPELVPPAERTCECCGRRDRWDDETGHWRIVVRDDERLGGDPFCVHEWDVTGDYNPVPE
jgi:hypothetical protein